MGQKLDLLIGVKEENLSELLKYHSTGNNLEVRTFSATSGKELRKKLQNHSYHGVISDYYLDDETALEILEDTETDLPFIIHTKYHNGLLEQKAVKKGASAMIQKGRHLRYYNKILHKILGLSDLKEFNKEERADIKFRISESGEIMRKNGSYRNSSDQQKISDILDNLGPGKIEETIQETLELGISAAEVVLEDEKGLTNYRLNFRLLDNRPGIAVTGIPMEELQKVDKEVYTEMSEISG